jgi:hypothetical protein
MFYVGQALVRVAELRRDARRRWGPRSRHHFFEAAITECVAQIPAHAEKDDLGLIVAPLEEIDFGNRQTSEEDSGSGQSTIIDTRHPIFATQPAKLSIRGSN